MHSYQFLAAFSDSIIDNAWKWFLGGVLITLALAIRDTPNIWREIKSNSGCKKIWPVMNLLLHWLAVGVTSVGALASQLGSDRSDSEIKRLKTDFKQQSSELAKINTNIANMDPITGPVRTVEAHVLLVFAKQVAAKNRNVGTKCAFLSIPPSTNGFAIWLTTEQFHEHINPPPPDGDGEHKITLDFRLSPDELGGGIVLGKSLIPASEAIKILDGYQLDLRFMLPSDAEIIRGSVAFRINGALNNAFSIPPRQRVGDFGVVR